MGKEARYKKESKEVDVWNTEGREAISVLYSQNSASANVNIWNIVGFTLRRKISENVYMHVIVQLGLPEMAHFAFLDTLNICIFYRIDSAHSGLAVDSFS